MMNLFYQSSTAALCATARRKSTSITRRFLMTSNLSSDIMQLLDAQPEATEPELHELLRPLLLRPLPASLTRPFPDGDLQIRSARKPCVQLSG